MIVLILAFLVCFGTDIQNGFSTSTIHAHTTTIPTHSTSNYIITNVTVFSLTSPTLSPSTATTTKTTTKTTTTTTKTTTTQPTTQHTTDTTSTSSSSSTTTTTVTISRTTVANTTVNFNPDTCSNSNYVRLWNGTCVTKLQAQTFTASILRGQNRNTTTGCFALSLYINSITNATTLSNKSNTLSADEIDSIVSDFDEYSLSINSNTSFLTVQQPVDDDNVIILGASFKRGIGGQNVDTMNQENITTSFISAAGIVDRNSLNGVTSLRMFIIDQPTSYENIDNTDNKTVVSSVIVADLKRNSSTYNFVNISLYFKLLSVYRRNTSGKYLCSFYDNTKSRWNETGCTRPQFNFLYQRYECSCNHLTSFALIWLPESISTTNSTKSFGAQDIASLVAQFISILCFLLVIIHAIRVRMSNSLQRLHTLKLLPLLSTATTTVLFIFFIALSLTVYIQTSSNDETECFLSSKILMFITYFFLIFMFCIKTSVGYFYYLRFVRLFPQPSYRQLLIMVIISFLLALLSVALAMGLNTNSSFNIVQLYPYEFCWFTPNVIYYFLTIPIGIFLFVNIITIMLVAKSIITHALHGKTSKQRIDRFKRCAIILLSSAVTQGIGWLLGPFISFSSPAAAIFLQWIFVIINGLEGLWSIIIYVFIRQRQLDEQKRITAVMKITGSKGSSKKTQNVHCLFKDLRRKDANFVEN